MKKISIGIVSSIVLLGIFYFYEVEIFDATITESTGVYSKELSLKSSFFKQDLPDFVNQNELQSIKPSLKSWLLAIAIFIGLPVMIALRSEVKKKG